MRNSKPPPGCSWRVSFDEIDLGAWIGPGCRRSVIHVVQPTVWHSQTIRSGRRRTTRHARHWRRGAGPVRRHAAGHAPGRRWRRRHGDLRGGDVLQPGEPVSRGRDRVRARRRDVVHGYVAVEVRRNRLWRRLSLSQWLVSSLRGRTGLPPVGETVSRRYDGLYDRGRGLHRNRQSTGRGVLRYGHGLPSRRVHGLRSGRRLYTDEPV
jgi:hypothetical protein